MAHFQLPTRWVTQLNRKGILDYDHLPKKFNFTNLAEALDTEFNFSNILLLNSASTGIFFPNLFRDRPKIDRFIYLQSNHDEVIEQIRRLDKKFDLICVDSFHEYKESSEDFRWMVSCLSDSGFLISHDCNPVNKRSANPTHFEGEWCGVTYVAFVEVAYNNPNLFYRIINKDYGLGIISKVPMPLVKDNLNRYLQQQFLQLFKTSPDEAYDFFKLHAEEMVNLK